MLFDKKKIKSSFKGKWIKHIFATKKPSPPKNKHSKNDSTKNGRVLQWRRRPIGEGEASRRNKVQERIEPRPGVASRWVLKKDT